MNHYSYYSDQHFLTKLLPVNQNYVIEKLTGGQYRIENCIQKDVIFGTEYLMKLVKKMQDAKAKYCGVGEFCHDCGGILGDSWQICVAAGNWENGVVCAATAES